MKNLTLLMFIISISYQVFPQKNEYDYFNDEVMLYVNVSNLTEFQDGGTPLIKVVRSGNLKKVKKLVQNGANINKGVKWDGSPLIEASRLGYLDIVKYLVEKGADINIHIQGDETPLIRAAWNGHIEIVKYLIEKGADVNLTVRESYKLGVEKRNALRMAKVGNHNEVIAYLIKKGAQ